MDRNDAFDVLVVNGEGSMHHGRRAFMLKMHELRKAVEQGRPAWLVNSVWEANPADFDDVLNRLDGIHLRGIASAQDLEARHGVGAGFGLDLSYFAPIDETAPFIDLKGAVATTDVHTGDFGFGWLSSKGAADWARLDMTTMSWSSLVKTLRTASLLIAGRHHAMYAACRAKIPFVPVRSNSHKMEDLLWSASADIPVAQTIHELDPLVRHAAGNRKAYQRLFRWMEAQPCWTLPEPGERGVDPASSAGPPSLQSRADEALNRRAYAEAAGLWARALAEEGGDGGPPSRKAGLALVGGGRIDIGLPILARHRDERPDTTIGLRSLAPFARVSEIWADRTAYPDGGWWSALRSAAFHAEIGDEEGFRRHARAGLSEVASAHGATAATTADFFLVSRLLHLSRHDLAFSWRRDATKIVGGDSRARAQEDLFLASLARRFDPGALDRLDAIKADPAWVDPALKLEALRHRRMITPPGADIVEAVSEALRDNHGHEGLLRLALSTAGEAGPMSALRDVPGVTGAAFRAVADRLLPVARHLVRRGADNEAWAARADLLTDFETGRDRFMAILADPSIRVAVVGNSPCELGRGRGAEIDAHEVVIRFNAFDLSEPYQADYGRRADVVCQTYPLEPGMRSAPWVQGENILWVQRHAFHVFEERDWAPVLRMRAEGAHLGYVPRESYVAAARVLQATPSAGFLIAQEMKRSRGTLSRDDFFGFSFTDQLQGERRAHYFGHEPPSLIHDWRREAEAFEALFD